MCHSRKLRVSVNIINNICSKCTYDNFIQGGARKLPIHHKEVNAVQPLLLTIGHQDEPSTRTLDAEQSTIRSDIVLYDLLSLFRFWCQIVRVKHQDALGILLREPYVMLMKSNYGCQAFNLASSISRLT